MSDLSNAAEMAQNRGSRAGVVVQVKVKLLGVSKPPVWRRLQLDVDITLDRLHETILAAFGWAGYHLHVFQSGDEQFGVPESELELVDERRVSLGQLVGDIGDRLLYTYDLGDNWEHEIVVEELFDAEAGVRYPVLVAAKGACPPEDCGGRWGYAELKEIFANPAHERHQEMLKWLDLDNASAFDPGSI
jgi:Plasmid pRiA4b ORF-3-like protein